jgi:hypothetical protein
MPMNISSQRPVIVLVAVGLGLAVGISGAYAFHAPARAQTWQITFRASPDVVGAGFLPCPGCDGVLTPADSAKSAGYPLPPTKVRVIAVATGDVLLEEPMQPVGNTGSVVLHFNSAIAPPYTVFVEGILGTEQSSYYLCPNSPQQITIGQGDFDRFSASAAGRGRRYSVGWRYFRDCGESLGEVICAIKCWLSSIRGEECDWEEYCPSDPTPSP